MLFSGLSRLGLEGILLKDFTEEQENTKVLIFNALFIRILISFAFLASVFAVSPFISSTKQLGVYLMITTTALLFQSFTVLESFLLSQVQGKLISICKISALLLGSFCRLIFLLYLNNLTFLFLIFLLEHIILAFLYSYFCRGQLRSRSLRLIDIATIRSLLRRSTPLLMAGLSFTIFTNTDTIMIRAMLGDADVGYYAAAYKLITIWFFLPGLILTSLTPLVLQHGNQGTYYEDMKLRITTSLIWFSIIFALIVSLCASDIINVAYGEEYQPSIAPLAFLAWVNVFIFFNSCWNHWNILMDRTVTIFSFHLLTALLNVIFNYILIPHFGILGASYSILLSLGVTMCIFARFDRTLLPLFIKAIRFGH